MIDCRFARNDRNQWACRQCGWIYPLKADRPPRRNCPKTHSRGLGDTIARITKWLGIKPCGKCRKRQKLLNRWFPYRDRE